jgi:hypothetical protein
MMEHTDKLGSALANIACHFRKSTVLAICEDLLAKREELIVHPETEDEPERLIPHINVVLDYFRTYQLDQFYVEPGKLLTVPYLGGDYKHWPECDET